MIDAVRKSFSSSVHLVLVGHSVGAWLVLQVGFLYWTFLSVFCSRQATQAMKERKDDIQAAFLLFPTITHIVRTPNGERLSVCSKGYSQSTYYNLRHYTVVIPISNARLGLASFKNTSIRAQESCGESL